MTRHPAKFSDSIITLLNRIVGPGRALDPFAGTGKIHLLQRDDIYEKRETYGVELEPEWATLHPRTIVGNALYLPFYEASFDCVVTSPTYGNRLADHHNARDESTRHSYTHDIGRKLHEDNSGVMYFWQPQYREFHLAAWREAYRVLVPGGYAFINVSNFIRNGEEQDVVGMHAELLAMIGMRMQGVYKVETPRLRYGANSNARVSNEVVLVFRKNS